MNGQDDESIQQVARQLFEGVAPERHAELEEYWNRYQPCFNLLFDTSAEGTLIIGAGAYRYIQFNHRIMRGFWLAGFIAWEGYKEVHNYVTTKNADFRRFNEMIETFYAILRASNSATVPMPEGIPEPGIYPDLEKSAEKRAASELATFAVGWALLHELRHIQHQQEGTSASKDAPPEEKHAEELSCDMFATQFLLERVDDFASSQNVEGKQVRLKREIGIYFALFAITLLSRDCWGDSPSHPAVQARIDQVIKHMNGNGTRISDAIAHAAFGALWFQWPEAPGPFKGVE